MSIVRVLSKWITYDYVGWFGPVNYGEIVTNFRSRSWIDHFQPETLVELSPAPVFHVAAPAWRTELPTDGFARRRHRGDFIEARGFLGDVRAAIQWHLQRQVVSQAWHGRLLGIHQNGIFSDITPPYLANGPWNKSLNFIFPTKYVIPKSLKGWPLAK